MRTTVCCVVMCVLMLSISLKADLPAIPICTAAGEQSQPDIDGNWIVWHDARSGTSNCNIYGYILTEPGEVPICTVSGHQRYAAVSGNVVVWQDERSSQRDIYAYDLQARAPLTLPTMPLGDGIYQRYPDISGNYIIYEHMTSSYYNLFAYNVSTGTSAQIASADFTQTNSAIDRTTVVWTEDRGSGYQMYYCDIQQPNPAAKVSTSNFGQYYPAVSGDVVVWGEDRGTGTGYDIYGYDLAEGREFSIYSGNGNQTRPAICGNLIVWQDESKGSSDIDIWGLDITQGSPFPIAAGTQNDQLPALSGRRVVWQRGTSNFDIYMAEIPAPMVIAVVSPNGGEQVLAGTELEIGWEMTEGAAPEMVTIEFSPNDGQDWQMLETDIPFGDPGYIWNPIADVDSQQCRIRVSDASDSLVSDASEAFTIFQCNPDLTADITGDCFVGMDDFAELAAQWLVCGNPYDAGWCDSQ